MKKKTTKIIAVVIALLLIIGLVGPLAYEFVFSSPLEQGDEDNSINPNDYSIENISQLEADINELNEKTRVLNEELGGLTTQINEIDEKIKEAEAQEKKYSEESGNRFRVMCEKGVMSYLDIIFSAKNITDFVDRIVIAKELAEYDKNVMLELHDNFDKLSNEKKSIEEIVNQKNRDMDELVAANELLNNKKEELEKIYGSIIDNKEYYYKYISDIENAENGLKSEYISNGILNAKDIKKGYFVWPTQATKISSPFSLSRVNPVTGKVQPHNGVDIAASMGDPVICSAEGRVKFSGLNSGYGNCVIIDHGNGVNTLYAHMSALYVKADDYLYPGDMIGRVGSTGNSTGPHLHFEVIINGECVNPMQYFN